MEFNIKKLNRKEGNINIMFSFVVLSIVAILILFSIANEKINILSNRVEDSLVSSTLAGATVDLKQYAIDGKIVNINDEGLRKSYNAFKKALRENLKLNESYKAREGSMIVSKVNIDDFIVYSKINGTIHESKVSDEGISKSQHSSSMKTNNGKLIEDTTIYSKISFTIKILGKSYNVDKDVSVRVTEK